MSSQPPEIRLRPVYRNHFSNLHFLIVLPYYFLANLLGMVYPVGGEDSTIVHILFGMVIFVFHVYAIGMLTYSTFHAINNRPLDFFSTLKAVSSSFFPLCSTMIIMQVVQTLFGFAIRTLVVLICNGAGISGMENFSRFNLQVEIIVCMVAPYLHPCHVLSNVVILVESKKWYEPIKRSSHLLESAGMELYALQAIAIRMTFFGIFGMCLFVFVWRSLHYEAILGFYGNLLPVLWSSITMAETMRLSVHSIVVLYVHCRKMQDK